MELGREGRGRKARTKGEKLGGMQFYAPCCPERKKGGVREGGEGGEVMLQKVEV